MNRSLSNVAETITANDQVFRKPEDVRAATARVVADVRVLDMHTHLFPLEFGELSRWGIDELLTYHYLVAEVMRSADIAPAHFRSLSRPAQADLIWDTLFVRNTPISEATRGVVAVLTALGVDPASPTLRDAREFFRSRQPQEHLSWVLDRAGVDTVVMTNDPFDSRESDFWKRKVAFDSRFRSALRLDPMLNDWTATCDLLTAWGYPATATVDSRSITGARRFLDDWIERMSPLYLAVSLPDDFTWPEDSARGHLIHDVVLPVCREHNLPFAMMIGVRRGVNPDLHDAGDGLGRADVSNLHRLCRTHSQNRFLVTMLSRENQHELTVAARKFANLMPFGAWWFLNNPSIVLEMTRQRLELLGATFVAQHSDARILDQLLYKWPHSRRVVADALGDQYAGLIQNGRPVRLAEIKRDVERLFADNFRRSTPLATASSASPVSSS
jgi:hypothetical protein